MSPGLARTRSHILRRAQSRIRDLVLLDVVPRSELAKGFARLNDHIDANTLLLDADGNMEREVVALYRRRDGVATVNAFYSGVITALEAWMKTYSRRPLSQPEKDRMMERGERENLYHPHYEG